MHRVQQERPLHLRLCDGRPSGCVIDGDRLVRRVQGSKHMLRRPPAWSFEVALLQEASRLGATQVVVVDTETGISYTAPLSALWQKGICIQRGHGEQVALPLTLWRREDPLQGTLF